MRVAEAALLHFTSAHLAGLREADPNWLPKRWMDHDFAYPDVVGFSPRAACCLHPFADWFGAGPCRSTRRR